ncbi:hypothetical protein [Leptospira yasudae]|uniref:Uncharacterized protein n=1 Tax=Leptospira yasudae TaxID=2202201 RepID=A0A6N4R285_9LEPT|nr:hypothetical protein [Leptospira yasudae]TGL76463.1 hypothetical protein EHQ77_18945 [Leptospira yasudae]TGL83386.1 hypothetical protein EHQ72_02860 [Leptospira yasudae]TGL89466.1 hypothetical protein EHQ83_01670 [Leptospira yasudae]
MNRQNALEHHSFLNQLSERILEELDLNVLLIPNETQKNRILLLEKEMGAYVVLYKKDVEPQGRHLCKTIRSAVLNEDQIRSVMEFERELRQTQDLIVVAYQKPITYF